MFVKIYIYVKVMKLRYEVIKLRCDVIKLRYEVIKLRYEVSLCTGTQQAIITVLSEEGTF